MEKVLIKSIIAAFVIEITGAAVNLFVFVFCLWKVFARKTAVWRRVDGVGRFCFILYPFWIFAYGQEEGRRLNFAVFG